MWQGHRKTTSNSATQQLQTVKTWGWKKLCCFHKIYVFLSAQSPEKCMNLVYLSPCVYWKITAERQTTLYARISTITVWQRAALLSFELIKKDWSSHICWQPRITQQSLFVSVWEHVEGQHPWVSSCVLSVLPYVPALYFSVSNCVIYLFADIVKCHHDLEKPTKELFLDEWSHSEREQPCLLDIMFTNYSAFNYSCVWLQHNRYDGPWWQMKRYICVA